MTFKSLICAVAGAAGGIITYFIGGWTMDVITLFIFMLIDFLMGLIVAVVFHKSKKTENGALSSKESFKGLCKKVVIMLLVGVGHMLDLYMNINFIRSGVIIGFMVNELISIVENAGLMGITSPIISEAIEILKKKVDEHYEN